MFSFTNPDKNIAELHLDGSEWVAVFGSGAGGHSFALLKALTSDGSVIAIDVRPEMLERVQSDADRFHKGNLAIKRADYERVGGTGLQNNSVDIVVVPNTLFTAQNKEDLLKEAFRVCKQGGKLLVIDWRESFNGVGPQAEHIVSKEKAQELAESVGFSCKREFTAGAHHYGLLFGK